ncbi:hypothetical protein GCM10027565_48640 [Bordetella tumulicola]
MDSNTEQIARIHTMQTQPLRQPHRIHEPLKHGLIGTRCHDSVILRATACALLQGEFIQQRRSVTLKASVTAERYRGHG